MWQNTDLAQALHRARAAETSARTRSPRLRRPAASAGTIALRPAPVR